MFDLSALCCDVSPAYLGCTVSFCVSEIETQGVPRSDWFQWGRPARNSVGQIMGVVSAGVQSMRSLVSMETASPGKPSVCECVVSAGVRVSLCV